VRRFGEGRALWRVGWGAVTGSYGHGEGGWGVATALLLSLVTQFEGK